MSTGAHAAELSAGPARRRPAAVQVRTHAVRERPLVRIAAFTALALYGDLRWANLLGAPPTGRLLGLLGVVVGLAVLGPLLRGRSRALAALAAVAAVLAALALSGIPLAWIAHLRIAVAANAIGQGLAGLPQVLVPYAGIDPWVRLVIVMGAAVLLLDAGLLLAFSPAALGDARRAGVALPLIALAVVPSTLLRPQLPYLHGLMLFVLIAAFMWGERVRRRELAWALSTGAVAAAAAMLLAPSLDPHRPWIDYRALAGGLAPARLDVFDWSQRYGPLNWPQTGREVLDVQAQHGDYWKAEDLDTFNGRAWVAGSTSPLDPLAGVSRSSLTRWRQTIHVTLRGMTTSTVIAAGTADFPKYVGSSVVQGASPGTWITAGSLRPGDSYLVTTYTPRPGPGELAAAGNGSPGALAGYRSIALPGSRSLADLVAVLFPPFHSRLPISSGVDAGGRRGMALVRASPYARAFALAQRLAGPAPTPYAFVTSVERYLSRGFSYDENPPTSSYPLESFLFKDRRGYCQQFAGAMALLLRMGGVPARVAAGFTSGTYDASTREWVVSDLDAHAWVEAWFPRYGWVRFDPTPAQAPARGGRAPISAVPSGGGVPSQAQPFLRHELQVSASTRTPLKRPSASSHTPVILTTAVALPIALLCLTALAWRRRRVPPSDVLLLELERALNRSGRPLATGITLAGLEHRLRSSPEAAGYVRALRLARFGGGAEPPSAVQRRALRAHLRAGLGFPGALRALWALPPGWPPARRASRRRFGA